MKEPEADVVDISPILCPDCRAVVGEEDAYCERCGINLLEPIRKLCSMCGKALSSTATFCSGCGTAAGPESWAATDEHLRTIDLDRTLPFDDAPWVDLDDVEYEEVDDLDEPEPRRIRSRRRGRRWLYAALVAVVVSGAAAAAWWFGYRQPDLQRFEEQLEQATVLASSTQEAVDTIDDPSDLETFSSEIADIRSDIVDLRTDVAEIRDGGRRSSLDLIVTAELGYLRELSRLADLPSAEARPSEYVRVGELANDLESAFERAQAFDSSFEIPSISASPLTSALADLAAYREEVLKERERARRINRQRAAELGEVNAFTDRLDGIITRYSAARAELAEWIDEVDTYGASFHAAYSKLDQQVALRTELRSELAALTPPDPFGADQAALLGVMDSAVTATQDAYRGIEEFQFDFQLRYLAYYETPGWQSFEAQTDEISDRYEAALADYEDHKAETIKRLEKRVPLPELPE